MERGRLRKAALNDHAVAVAKFRMTHRAIDPVALLTPLDQRRREGGRLSLLTRHIQPFPAGTAAGPTNGE